MTDGAIALDLEAVRALVGAVGPLQVPGIAEPVTGENALQWMKAAWESPAGATAGPEAGGGGDAWWTKRKDFMGELVKAALSQGAGGRRPGHGCPGSCALRLARRSTPAGRRRRPHRSAVLAQQGWDGGLRPPDASDFLLVVDSNVGFNKANMFVQQALDYRVAESADGAGSHAHDHVHAHRPGQRRARM